jgi:hypothetical protein
MSKVSVQSVRDRLSTKGISDGPILLDGQHIGRFVRYGKFARPGSAMPKTVFAGRIYRNNFKIEAEGTTLTSLLNKVARSLAQSLKNGVWTAE